MGKMQGGRARSFEEQPFAYSRLPIVNPVDNGDFERKCLALKANGKRFSVWQCALVGLYQSKRRAGQSLPVAGEGKFESRSSGRLYWRDEFCMGSQVRKPLRNQARCSVKRNSALDPVIANGPALADRARSGNQQHACSQKLESHCRPPR